MPKVQPPVTEARAMATKLDVLQTQLTAHGYTVRQSRPPITAVREDGSVVATVAYTATKAGTVLPAIVNAVEAAGLTVASSETVLHITQTVTVPLTVTDEKGRHMRTVAEQRAAIREALDDDV